MTQQKQQLLIDLLRLIDQHFNEEELRTLCYDLRLDYDNLGGETKAGKARELISYLDRHRCLAHLIHWGKKNRAELQWDCFEELVEDISGVLFIDFVNRGKELDKVFLSVQLAQYWIIDAPAGYGKTEFLREIKRRYDALGWVTASTSIPRSTSPDINALIKDLFRALGVPEQYNDHANISDLVERFASCLVKATLSRRTTFGDIAIFIDNIEVLNVPVLEELVEFMAKLYDRLSEATFFRQQNRIRFFFAGRDARRKLSAIRKLPFTKLALSPYAFEYVEDTVRKYAQKANALLTESEIANIAACLMYLGGGHPGCIADILVELANKQFVGFRSLLQPHPQTVLDRVTRTLDDLFAKSEPGILELVPILETLSVFRRFRPWLLRELLDKGYIQWNGNERQLEQALLGTYLVNRDHTFLQDSITRQLLSIRLRLNDTERFKNLCRDGVEIYRNRLPNSPNPDQLAVEYIYLLLQHAYYVEKACAKQLEEKLVRALQDTVADLNNRWEQEPGVVEGFFEHLEEDWELEFTANYFLGLGSFGGCCSYDHSLYKKMIDSVRGASPGVCR